MNLKQQALESIRQIIEQRNVSMKEIVEQEISQLMNIKVHIEEPFMSEGEVQEKLEYISELIQKQEETSEELKHKEAKSAFEKAHVLMNMGHFKIVTPNEALNYGFTVDQVVNYVLCYSGPIFTAIYIVQTREMEIFTNEGYSYTTADYFEEIQNFT